MEIGGLKIDSIVCLCLNERIERYNYVKKHLIENGINCKFMFNKLHENPRRGCLESHIKAIKYAKENNFSNILIFEDDIKIIEKLENISKLPKNWDMIYLGGLCTNYKYNYDENWVRGVIWCNHAYIVNKNLFDTIIDKGWSYTDGTSDHFFTSIIHNDYNCYIPSKQYIIQKEGLSDLCKKHKWNEFKWPNPGTSFNIP